jgi:hypothetical protein
MVRMGEHDKWLSILEKAFNEKGYATIREGKMFIEGKHWKTPDSFVFQNNGLDLVLEVIVTESYPRVLTKVKRIKQHFNPKHIVVFESIMYLDVNFLPARRDHYKKILHRYPDSYEEIDEHFIKEWRKNGLEVIFWNETNYCKKLAELSQ